MGTHPIFESDFDCLTDRNMTRKVCYYYDNDVGNYYYGQGHPMKPHRIRMTHNLLVNYGLYRKMQIYRAARTSQEDMTRFHSDDYIKFLKHIRPDNMNDYQSKCSGSMSARIVPFSMDSSNFA